MTHILHRSLRASLPVAVRGRGIVVTDAEGRDYLDASGGAAVSCLGHGHPDVLAAMHAQIDRIAYAHTSFFTTEVAEALADRLVRDAPPGISHVFLVSGGSEAIEASLKLARQYFVEIGEPQRRHFIARRQSYHGNTLGALAVGGNAARRAQFAPLLIDVTHVAPCYEYRDRRADESAQAYGETACGASSKRRSSDSGRAMSSASSRNPSSAPPSARCRRCPAIFAASARSATGTASCSSPTR